MVHLDDFHLPVPDAVLDGRSAEDNFEDAFDTGYITEKILKPLRHGRVSSHRILNPEASDYGKTRVIKPGGFVVVEGVYSLRPIWTDFYDLKIWLKMGKSMRLERMKKRGANSKSQMKCWQKTEKWYIKGIKPAALADIILDVNVSAGSHLKSGAKHQF